MTTPTIKLPDVIDVLGEKAVLCNIHNRYEHPFGSLVCTPELPLLPIRPYNLKGMIENKLKSAAGIGYSAKIDVLVPPSAALRLVVHGDLDLEGATDGYYVEEGTTDGHYVEGTAYGHYVEGTTYGHSESDGHTITIKDPYVVNGRVMRIVITRDASDHLSFRYTTGVVFG